MNPTIEELTSAVEREARKRPAAQRLMTHPGVGPLTALAFVLIIGIWERFPRGKQLGNYVGMIPSEDSSAGKQRLGHISKQGNSLLRFLLVEAAQAAARVNPDWRRRYIHLAVRRHRSIAKVAMGRRLAIRLYWMWRNGCETRPMLPAVVSASLSRLEGSRLTLLRRACATKASRLLVQRESWSE